MRLLRLALAPLLASAALLSACGGDELTDEPAVATGVLTDSPVQGVAYRASPSGLSGKTNAAGEFSYEPGDTVVFRIGALELGRARLAGTTATVTPITLVGTPAGVDAAGRADRVTNLLVLLQTLDADNNPLARITIPDAAAAAVTPAVALALEAALAGNPDDFDDIAVNTTLATLLTTLGDASVVSRDTALANFKYQFMLELPGFYVLRSGSEIVALRIDYHGNYVIGVSGGTPGLERGKVDWDPASGQVSLVAASIDIDENGAQGFSTLGSGEKLFFALEGNDLLIGGSAGDTSPLRLSRVGTSTTTLRGAFAAYDGAGSSESFDVAQFFFLGDGRYVMLDPNGDVNYTVAYDALCSGSPGMEFGSYTFSGGQLITSSIDVDTNGCAGLHDKDTNSYAVLAPLTVSYGGSAANGVYQGSPETGVRLMTYPRYIPTGL